MYEIKEKNGRAETSAKCPECGNQLLVRRNQAYLGLYCPTADSKHTGAGLYWGVVLRRGGVDTGVPYRLE